MPSIGQSENHIFSSKIFWLAKFFLASQIFFWLAKFFWPAKFFWLAKYFLASQILILAGQIYLEFSKKYLASQKEISPAKKKLVEQMA